MVELLQKALDMGLSWVATLGLAWYVWHLHTQLLEAMKEAKQSEAEIRDKAQESITTITENFAKEVESFRETVANNTAVCNTLCELMKGVKSA